jgi:hypothetical protein
MESFEDGIAKDTERTKLATKLAVLAGVVVILVVVTFLGVHGHYIDVEQVTHVSEATPTAVAVHDTKTSR